MAERELIIDWDDRQQKAKWLTSFGVLSGKWRFTMRPYKPRRSLRANSYYWACIIPSFVKFMQSHGQFFEPEEAHEFLLQKFASKNVVDPKTGEVLSVIGCRSSKMDGGQFAEYINNCKEWLLDRFGVIVPEPELFRKEE